MDILDFVTARVENGKADNEDQGPSSQHDCVLAVTHPFRKAFLREHGNKKVGHFKEIDLWLDMF